MAYSISRKKSVSPHSVEIPSFRCKQMKKSNSKGQF